MFIFVILFIFLPTLFASYWLYFKPTSLWTGFFFLSFISGVSIMAFIGLEQLNSTVAFIIAAPIALLLIGLAIFGIYAMIIALFWNERVLLKYEKKSLGNMLPLLLATALMIFEIILLLVTTKVTNAFILKLFGFLNVSLLYFSLIFILFSLTTVLYNLFPIKYKVDYIIVLGAGLYKDKVTPLLAARIKAGLKLYQQQVTQLNHYPTIILSGGQGPDEGISEAQAMKNYLDEEHYEVKKIYLEDKSTNTKENILFSERVASSQDNISGIADKKIVIATNNYHLLRAGKLAKTLGINARGKGARTKLYYLPTGFIREYIGYLVMTKKIHIAVIASILVITVLPLVLSFVVSFFLTK